MILSSLSIADRIKNKPEPGYAQLVAGLPATSQ